MRGVRLTFIGLVVLVCNAFAQERAEQAKYELIRQTIDFLATDKVVSRDTNFRVLCETLDYDCFQRELSAQPIAGIEQWYNRWRTVVVRDSAGLAALRDRVFADIIERAGKGYRKQLAGYAAYVSGIGQLIDRYAQGMPVLETDADRVRDTALIPPDQLPGSEADPTEPFIIENDNPEKENTMIVYLTLVIGIIALIGAALAILRIRQLERQIADSQSEEAVAHLIEIMESIEKRVVALEGRKAKQAEEWLKYIG